ncbi:hypothetical protein [Roseomonas alba]|uniref:dioxygenase family protein n=1 Tax=Roseomonas alba TaxID=2846776 RepID=UPI001CA4CBE0
MILPRRGLLAGIGTAMQCRPSHRGRPRPALLRHAGETCRLTPQAIEGPFYRDPSLERADITEGKPGVKLDLRLQVVEGANCQPLPGARVDVWHGDALGAFSGYPGQTDTHAVSTVGQTFLRGTQFADSAGQVAFNTIYPG